VIREAGERSDLLEVVYQVALTWGDVNSADSALRRRLFLRLSESSGSMQRVLPIRSPPALVLPSFSPAEATTRDTEYVLPLFGWRLAVIRTSY